MTLAFSIPEGFVAPDGVKEGSTFDALATLELGPDKLTLVAIDGLPVGEAKSEEPETEDDAEEPGEEMGFDEAVRSGMMEG